MSDSDASTVDPNDIHESRAALSDSDASTVDPENLEDTVPLDSSELRHLNNSPDLFADYTDMPKKNFKDDEVKERDQLKVCNAKNEKIVKRRSKVHEVSDSGSDSDEKEIVSKKSTDVKEKTRVTKKDITENKPYKKNYSKPFDSKSDANVVSKEKMDKQKFISEFLNMSDDDVDIQKNVSKSKKEEKHKTKSDIDKRIKDESEKGKRNSDKQMNKFNKTETDTVRDKHRQLETHAEKTSSNDLAPVSLKWKSKSPSPQVLKKSDTKILDTDKNTNSNGSLKPPCKYGSKCYRKNPSHKQEFSHPENHQPSASTSTGRDSPPNKKVKVRKSRSRSKSPPAKKVKVRESPPPRSKSSPAKSKSLLGTPKTIADKVSQAQPYSFFLTRVMGISAEYNASFVMDVKDILCPEMGALTASCQFNYMFDVEWLMKQYPPQFRSKPVLLVHGEQGASKANLQAEAINYKNVRFCQAKLEMMYGTHHTKMMLLLYETGLRVVIHTSNLIQQDWHQKTQGMWISPLFPKLPSPSKDSGDSPTHFKKDLIDYLSAYKAYQLQEWIEHLASHDMSEARVVIVGSVPGRHTTDKYKWGHLKLRKVLQDHGPSFTTVKTWPVIGQFSSIGSMGASKDQWLCGEWLESLSAAKSVVGVQSKARLQLIFPSKDNVRLSLEGFPAGGSIPYSVNTAKKQPWLHDFFHIWKSETRGRSRAMPHIKTFLRPSQDAKHCSWFIVTSANLSKAAWGAFEKKGAQLMIRSYEIGVLLLPKFFGEGETFTIANDIEDARSHDHLLLPYDLPPTIYKKGDRPWMWDIPYMDLPDTNGNMWCPFSK